MRIRQISLSFTMLLANAILQRLHEAVVPPLLLARTSNYYKEDTTTTRVPVQLKSAPISASRIRCSRGDVEAADCFS